MPEELTHSSIVSQAARVGALAESEKITLLVIEHNMRVITAVAQRIVALYLGEKIADGAPDVVTRDRRVVEVEGPRQQGRAAFAEAHERTLAYLEALGIPEDVVDATEHLLRMADGTIRYRMTNTAMLAVPALKKDGSRMSLSSDVCGSCHGEPARHGRFQQ